MLAAKPTSISKSVPVSDLCVQVFSSPNLSPFNSNSSTRNLASFVDALDAVSSLSPLSATLTKNTRGWGGVPSISANSVPGVYPDRVGALRSTRALTSTDPFAAPRSLSSLPFDFKLSTVNLLSPISFRIRTSAKCNRNLFTMNTSKTQDLKLFRINTYEKTGGGVPRLDDHKASAVANHFGQHANLSRLQPSRAGSYTGGPAKSRVWRSGSEVPCNGVARQPFSWPCKSVLNSLRRPNCELLIAFAAVVASKESSACRKPQYRKK